MVSFLKKMGLYCFTVASRNISLMSSVISFLRFSVSGLFVEVLLLSTTVSEKIINSLCINDPKTWSFQVLGNKFWQAPYMDSITIFLTGGWISTTARQGMANLPCINGHLKYVFAGFAAIAALFVTLNLVGDPL